MEAALSDEVLKEVAVVNSVDKFQLVFHRILEALFIDRMDLNEEIFTRFMSEGEFRHLISKQLGSEVYKRLNDIRTT